MNLTSQALDTERFGSNLLNLTQLLISQISICFLQADYKLGTNEEMMKFMRKRYLFFINMWIYKMQN